MRAPIVSLRHAAPLLLAASIMAGAASPASADTQSKKVRFDAGSTVSKKTLADYSNSMVAYWAGQKNSADTAHSNQSVVQANLQSSMASISSVSTDQELAKLIQLQSTYAANAQVLSTLRDMLNTLVNSI